MLSDLRGLQKCLKIGGTPAEFGCIKCWLQSNGKCNSQGKTIYNGTHYTLLPAQHPLRQELYKLHNPKGAPRAVDAASSLRYRSHQEVLERMRTPPTPPLLAPGEKVCAFHGCSLRQGCEVTIDEHDREIADLPPSDDTANDSDGSSDSSEASDEENPTEAAVAPDTSSNTTNPMGRLRVWNYLYMVVIDAMHTMGGVLRDLTKLLQGLKQQPNVDVYELQHNNRDFGSAHLASKRICHTMSSC